MNSNRLAVFAASLQLADTVEVVSRGTPRSQTLVTWVIRWSVSAAEKGEKSIRRFLWVYTTRKDSAQTVPGNIVDTKLIILDGEVVGINWASSLL